MGQKNNQILLSLFEKQQYSNAKKLLHFFNLFSDIVGNMIEIPYCPVIKPTWKEFRNFRQFVEKLDRLYKHTHGIVKVVPPPQWKPRRSSYEQILKNLVINGPIQQNLYGKGGIYECLHIAKKSLSYEEYKQKTAEIDKAVENMSTDQIQETFWKNIVFSPPLYGADLLNSLMEQSSAGQWDLKSLPSVLNDALHDSVRGINNPYCYVGSWKALFCWHKQDLDLSAINYVHKGKTKFWYAIRSDMGQILQKQAAKYFPDHYSHCSQFLRHKTTLISPYLLKKKIPQLVIHKVAQQQNQFVLAFGGAYHCGFNFGFNLAEAVNYATNDWLRQIPQFKPCSCLKTSVKASPVQIYKNLKNTDSKKSNHFVKFQEFIFNLVQKEDEEESEDQETKKAVKDKFSKKIRKSRKQVPKKIHYKGQDFQIDQWLECQKCKKWRIVTGLKVKNKSFTCKQINKKCTTKQKAPKNYFLVS